MQCNQPFGGNGFTNGTFCSYNNTPLQCSTGMYPELVGEGEITSLTLPDGTIQFFFMPTVKWWASNPAPCYPNVPTPLHSNFPNTNCNPSPWNNSVGTWFIRSISNPVAQNNWNPPLCQRYEAPRFHQNSDYNMTPVSNGPNANGYQLKFHNDNWSSTTDLHYFCPNLRQRDYALRQPCKGTAAVQVETVPVTNHTTCHYEVLCSKPCNCNATLTKPMSLVSVVQPSNTKSRGSSDVDDCSCDDIEKRRHKRKKGKVKKTRSKNVICACESTDKIVTVDKSITTYAEMGSGRAPVGGCETQTCEIAKPQCSLKKTVPQNCCGKSIPMFTTVKCEVKKAETWHPVTPFSKKDIEDQSSYKLIDSDNECNGGYSSNCSCYSS